MTAQPHRDYHVSALLTIWRYGRRTEGIESGASCSAFVRGVVRVGAHRDPLLSALRPVATLSNWLASETKARDPMRQMTSDLFATWWQHHGSSLQTAHRLDLEVQKIIDPHGRGRQHVAAQLEKLAETRIARFVLSDARRLGRQMGRSDLHPQQDRDRGGDTSDPLCPP